MKRYIVTSKKVLMPVFLSFTIGATLVGCQINQTGTKQTTKTREYTITPEVANPELTMNNQPTAPHWFPSELLTWSPSDDQNLAYNQSVIPLAQRVHKDKLTPINQTQDKDREVVAISIMNSSTSGNPSQGSNKFGANIFSYWQYIDKLVYWGGSAGEGLIIPPSADVTNAAHKNGVPVLGTIFFPMIEHGGQMAWLDEFLTKDETGNFLIVDKLIEVATTYGFDGWFINQETQGTAEQPLTSNHAQLMQELIIQFKAKANLEIMWYDSMTKDGEMNWQNSLTEQNEFFIIGDNQEAVADSMFLNFWWTDYYAEAKLLEASTRKANELGINPKQLFAGIDVQANGINTPIRWDLFEAGNTSLGIYCPSWSYTSAISIDDFHAKENRLWVNEHANPALQTNAKDQQWRGISTYAIEKTVINSLPFITNFNLGHGYNFFIEGEKVSATDWNNRSMADILPTYRWIIEHEDKNELSVDIDYANAYYGGNSIKLTGTLEPKSQSTIKLYSTDLTLTDSTTFKTSVKSSHDLDLNLVLEFDNGDIEIIKAENQLNVEAWSTLNYNVSKFKGKTVKNISFSISANEAIDELKLNLGNISITEASHSKPAVVKNVKVDDVIFDEDAAFAGVKLSWEVGKNTENGHFEIYQINQDQTKSFLGTTLNHNFYYNALPRELDANETQFEVVAMNQNGEVGNTETVKMSWPDNRIPKANFKLSKTLVAPGENLTLINKSSPNTETYEWQFIGADIESSHDESPIISYESEGVYSITLTVKNKAGESVKVMEEVLTVSTEAEQLVNVALNKPVEAFDFVNDNEASHLAVDGNLETKWCATGSPPHTITIDLEEVKRISEIHLAHAEAGGESPGMNTKGYTIEVSTDGVTFEEIVNVTQNTLAQTVDTFKVIEARYVKVTATKPTQNSDTAVRIYEIAVLGLQ